MELFGKWLEQGEGEAGRGDCSLLAVQEQVEQMRESEEEVEENSNLLSAYQLRGNGLHVSFHLFPADMSICEPRDFVWNQSWLTSVALAAFFSFEMDLYYSQATLL